ILEPAAAQRIVLETQRHPEIRTVKVAVLGKDVAYAARDLAAHRNTAVAISHLTAANDDVFRRHGHPPPVVIAAGVDRYAVIASSEDAVLDQHVATGFGIATVCVWPSFIGRVGLALDVHAAHRHVRAKHGVNLPHRRMAKCYTFDQDILAAIR